MKSKHFIISPKIFPFKIIVSLGEKDKKIKKLLKRYKASPSMLCTSKTCDGYYELYENNYSLIRIYKYPATPFHFGVLQHEILHAVINMMDSIGIKLSRKSEEVYTYLMGYLTEEIYKKIWK